VHPTAWRDDDSVSGSDRPISADHDPEGAERIVDEPRHRDLDGGDAVGTEGRVHRPVEADAPQPQSAQRRCGRDPSELGDHGGIVLCGDTAALATVDEPTVTEPRLHAAVDSVQCEVIVELEHDPFVGRHRRRPGEEPGLGDPADVERRIHVAGRG
jgi:hypothetical protein